MAQVVRYVNAASSGGDGTTNATSGATAAYASLSAWEAAEQTNLVTDGDYHTVKCEGSTADSSATTVAGWTTDSTHYIEIICEDGVGRHDGSFDTSAYRLALDPGSGAILTIEVNYVRIQGLQFYINADADGRTCVYMDDAKYVEIGWCIVRGTPAGSGGYQTGLRFSGASGDDAGYGYVHDCTIYDCGTYSGGGTLYGGIWVALGSSSTPIYIYNVTIFNCGNNGGIAGNYGTCYAKNVVANDAADGGSERFEDKGANFSFHANSATCISDDSTEPAGKSASPTFVNEGTRDLHLDAADTVAKEYGTDLSSDSDLDSFHTASTTDIDNTSRTVSWDAGSHELSSGGAAANPKGVFGLALHGPLTRAVYA